MYLISIYKSSLQRCVFKSFAHYSVLFSITVLCCWISGIPYVLIYIRFVIFFFLLSVDYVLLCLILSFDEQVFFFSLNSILFYFPYAFAVISPQTVRSNVDLTDLHCETFTLCSLLYFIILGCTYGSLIYFSNFSIWC